MLADIQSLTNWFEPNALPFYPFVEMLNGKLELNCNGSVVDFGDINSDNKQSINLEENIPQNWPKLASIDSCKCPSSDTMLQQVRKHFQLFLRFVHHSNDFNLIKILSWTKSVVDRNVLKVCLFTFLHCFYLINNKFKSI